MAYALNPFTGEFDYYVGAATGAEIIALLEALAAGDRLSHDDGLSDVSADDHHAQTHGLASAYHTVAGLTTGHFIKATGATSFAFGAHGLTYSDVGAEVSGAVASHESTYNHANYNTAYGWGNHAGLYDPAGTMTTHQSTYNHANYDTAYDWGDHASGGYALQSVLGTSIGTGLLLTTTVLSVSTVLQTYHGINPSAGVQSLLGCADEAAIRTLLDLEPGTDFYSTSTLDTALGLKANLTGPTFTGTVTVPSTNFTIGSTTFSEAQLQTNLAKISCTFTNVQTALGAASGAVAFNSQALTGVGAIGCGTVTSTGNLVIADNGTIGSVSTPGAMKIDAVGNMGVGINPSANVRLYFVAPDAQSTIYYGVAGETYSDAANNYGVFGYAGGGGGTSNIGVYGGAVGAANNYHFYSRDDDHCSGGAWNDSSHSSRKKLIRDLTNTDLKELYSLLDNLSMKSYRHKAEIPILGYEKEKKVEFGIRKGEPEPIYDDPLRAPERFGLMADDINLPGFLASKGMLGLSGGRLANYSLICHRHVKSLIEDLTQRLEALEGEA